MTDQPKKKSRMWEFLLIFALVYLASDMAVRYFFPKATPAEEQRQVELLPQSDSFRLGHEPVLTLKNNAAKAFTFVDRCPMPPMDVFAMEGTGGALVPLTTTVTAIPCAPFPVVGSGAEASLSFAPWKYSLFEKPGTYEVHLRNSTVDGDGSGALLTARFSMHEPGTIVKLFRTFITKPFLNFLIFIAAALPGHSLALGIIILTILVKLILFLPTQHSMEGQRKMQLLQPKIEELKKRFKDQPQKLHEETMKLWKEEKVNPFQSCLPILLQFPILIGLFYVIRDGTNLTLAREFIYPMYQNLSWNFNPSFFGLDLTETNWIFPPVLVILQYFQMKLSFATASKKQTAPVDPSQKLQQTMMTYTLPFMIGFFALNFPGAVSLYWGVSTLFAIGQQMIVNREKLKV
ncbi:membrane protein insertase YidC [Candidatus Peregrinibacteria bacterium]|nr:membrane protein insertase YidC [Candidatus Peregrinibacteria bacterium]